MGTWRYIKVIIGVKMQSENSKMKLSTEEKKNKLLLWKVLREIFWNIFNGMEITLRHNICKECGDNKQAETTNKFVTVYQQKD